MLHRLSEKSLRLQRVDLFIFAFILVATLLRFILIYFHWPATNSDEANMGILARHVAYNGEWPIFFYGLPYMGPIEGYIAAPLFHLFGPSTFTLRLGLLPFFPLFLLCMYYLTRLLYTQKFAIFIVIVLCFGSDEVIGRQLKAVGEYPELLFFAAFISFASSWLALSSYTVAGQARTTFRRTVIYGVLGLVMGIALWVDFLILPFLGTAVLLLLFFCRRELLSWAGISLLAGFVIGAMPLLYYNITAPLVDNSLVVLLSIHRSGSEQHLPFLQQIVGTLTTALPSATGFNPLCPPDAFPYFGTSPSTRCIVLQGGWSLGYLALWGLATFFIVRAVLPRWKDKSHLKPDQTEIERQHTISHYCQLMLLISAGGTLLLYALSPVAATVPGPTARYLECLLVAMPAVLWPLWDGIHAWNASMPWRATVSLFVRGGLLLLILITFVAGTIRTFSEVPQAQADYQQQERLVQNLLSLGATRIYSEYWTCNRLTFQSEERIICSALDEELRPGFDRYAPYRDIVRAAPHPTYVFPQGSRQVALLDARMKSDSRFASSYQRLIIEGNVVYVPER